MDRSNFTTPSADTFSRESPIAESRFLNLDMDNEVVDLCESALHTEGDLEKLVVLDSDDEGEGGEKVVVLDSDDEVNGEYVPVTGRFSGRGAIRLLKQQQGHAGFFRRHGYKFGEHVPLNLDPAIGVAYDDLSNAETTLLCTDSFEECHVVMDSLMPTSTDQENADEVILDAKYLDTARGSLPAYSHELISLNTGKDLKQGCEFTELKCLESPEPSESPDKVLDFVEHYLSVSDLGLHEPAEPTRKSNRMKSPPPLWSRGSQSLARRMNCELSDCKYLAYNWDTNQFENQTSGHDNLHKKMVTSFQSMEKCPGENDLDANLLNSKDINKLCSGVKYDLLGLNEQLDNGLSKPNVEICEQLKLTPDSLDFGLDTQIAAEAMEALVHATPAFDAGFGPQGSDSIPKIHFNAAFENSILHNVSYPEEAFVGWRCKAKRSRCIKIPRCVLLKNGCCSDKNQPETPSDTVVQFPARKRLRTNNLRIMKDLHCGNRVDTSNRKCRGPRGITLKQQEYGYTERDGFKDFQRHHTRYNRRSKEATHVTKPNSPPKQRKMIGLLYGEAGRNCLQFNCVSSFGVKLNSEERTLSKPKWLAYPKGKRTRQYAPCHLLGSRTPCSPSAEIESDVNISSIKNEEVHKRMDKNLVYTRRRKSSVTDSCSPSVSDSPFSDKIVITSIECDTPKSALQWEKSHGLQPYPLGGSGNMKSNEHMMGLPIFGSGSHMKQPCNYLSKSSLSKELTRLGYTESLPAFLPKDSRRRRAMDKVCILFSQNLKPNILKQQKKIVSRLGLPVASCCADATHFVADAFVRTRNMLEAIALGKPVVTHSWLESCDQAGYMVDEKNYILRDEKKEKEIRFNMSVSLTHACQQPLLKDRTILMTPNVKPSMDVITGLVKAVCGQTYMPWWNDPQTVRIMLEAQTKDKAIPDGLIVLSCEEDFRFCIPFLEKGVPIYDSELLLNGIVTQKLEYKRFELFKKFITKDR
ncbi:uncharacterized protein LOC127259073 [Andrographis paniculata]|uniref:uncharacterized protein LOC127259073 n=1 Tax=Andrographis paniculata TaxID=175694 RepID=UPI0021E8712F|nr:uncharacterized protein LOC127259073 [Andrographis paniculata]